MPLVGRGPHERGDKRGTPLLKRRYSTAISSSNVKIVAVGTDMLLIITSIGNEPLRYVSINDLK